MYGLAILLLSDSYDNIWANLKSEVEMLADNESRQGYALLLLHAVTSLDNPICTVWDR